MKQATIKRVSLALALALACGQAALAQGASVPFGGLQADPKAPVEISADGLAVDQKDGRATFSGNVEIGQGEMRLAAGKVVVEYASDGSNKIKRLNASGGVTLVSGGEAAEASEAVYTLDTGLIVMSGNVLLTQGPSAISGDRLVVNLANGTGRMEGRVKTVLQQGGN